LECQKYLSQSLTSSKDIGILTTLPFIMVGGRMPDVYPLSILVPQAPSQQLTLYLFGITLLNRCPGKSLPRKTQRKKRTKHPE
jgi:hypothetical protein